MGAQGSIYFNPPLAWTTLALLAGTYALLSRKRALAAIYALAYGLAMCVGHIHFGPSLVVEVDGFRNASAIPVAAVMCREGFLSGAAAFDLRPSLWLGCCQGNVCEQEDEVHISGGAVSAGSAV